MRSSVGIGLVGGPLQRLLPFPRVNLFVTQSDSPVRASQALSTENSIAFKLQGFCYHYNCEPDSQNQSKKKCYWMRKIESQLRSSPSYRECNFLKIICNLGSLSVMAWVTFYLQLPNDYPRLKFNCGLSEFLPQRYLKLLI